MTFRPAQFELVERAKFHILARSAFETVREFVVRIQQQASKCNFQESLRRRRTRPIGGRNQQAGVAKKTSFCERYFIPKPTGRL